MGQKDYSDHFIHGNRILYVLLSILFTLFLRQGFSPNSTDNIYLDLQTCPCTHPQYFF